MGNVARRSPCLELVMLLPSFGQGYSLNVFPRNRSCTAHKCTSLTYLFSCVGFLLYSNEVHPQTASAQRILSVRSEAHHRYTILLRFLESHHVPDMYSGTSATTWALSKVARLFRRAVK